MTWPFSFSTGSSCLSERIKVLARVVKIALLNTLWFISWIVGNNENQSSTFHGENLLFKCSSKSKYALPISLASIRFQFSVLYFTSLDFAANRFRSFVIKNAPFTEIGKLLSFGSGKKQNILFLFFKTSNVLSNWR